MAVDLRKLIDVRIDGQAATLATHDAILGGSNVVQQNFQCTSYSASNLDFVIQTPGLGVYMSRRVNIHVTIPVKFTVTQPAKTAGGTNGDGWTGVWGSNMGTCAFPFNSMLQSATVQISTSNFTTQSGQIMPFVKRMMQTEAVRQKLSEVPTRMSPAAVLVDGNQMSMSRGIFQCIDSAGAAYESAGVGSVSWRWANPATGDILANQWGVAAPNAGAAANPAEFAGYLTIEEPLLIQPFTYDDEVPAFINTNLINIRLNLQSLDLAKIIRFASSATAVPGTGAADDTSVSISQITLWAEQQKKLANARLWCSFITPPPTSKPPEVAIYPTQQLNPLATPTNSEFPPVNFGDSEGALTVKEIESQVITLNSAPDMLAIYAVPKLPASNDLRTTKTDGVPGLCCEDLMLCFNKIEILWNNNPSLLRTFTREELWRRTRQNGLPVSWAEFSGAIAVQQETPPYAAGTALAPTYNGTAYAPFGASKQYTYLSSSGSPVLLALNKDIPVEAGVAAGVAGVYTVKIKAEVINQLPKQFDQVTLYVVPISTQYLKLNVGATSDVNTTVATEGQVYACPVSGQVQDKKVLLHEGTNGLVGGPMAASARASDQIAKVIDMVGRKGDATIAGSGASDYVGAKRPYMAM